MLSVSDWASLYIKKGWSVVPLDSGQKFPTIRDWLKIDFSSEDFNDNSNLGIKSFGGIVIVDLDSRESVELADRFLPETKAVYGRLTRQRNKRLYQSKLKKLIKWTDEDKGTILELRVNHQDMAPPSVHPNGEVLQWVEGFDIDSHDPAIVDIDILKRSCRMLATSCFIAQKYPPRGNRHEFILSCSGMLRNIGLTEEECTKIIVCAAYISSDEKIGDREQEIRSTYSKPESEKYTGAKSLGDIGKTVRNFWGVRMSGDFARSKTGIVVGDSQDNIITALDKIGVKLSFDRFAKRHYIDYNNLKVKIDDSSLIRVWLAIDKEFKFRPTKAFFFDVAMNQAELNPYNPVIDYLESLTWDQVDRLDYWVINACGLEDTPYHRAVAKLPILAAVKRVLQPGCKFDEMLVIESSEQGLDKSSMIRALCPNEDWFSDNLPLNSTSKEMIEQTRGKWIIEAQELSGMNRKSVDHLKSILSTQIDGPARMAYARIAVEQPRQFIIIGTTNTFSYLVDATGNRRFWPVRIERECDVAYIKQYRDQLWAEAYYRVKTNNESIRMDPDLYAPASEQQESRRVTDPWEEDLRVIVGDYEIVGEYKIMESSLCDKLGIPLERRDFTVAHRIASVMQNLGYIKKPARINNKTVRAWVKRTGE